MDPRQVELAWLADAISRMQCRH